MDIGVSRESVAGETRVTLVPGEVRPLVGQEHEVLVEHGAGVRAGYPDEEYRDVVDDSTLRAFTSRLGDLARVLRSHDADDVVKRALNRARNVADVTTILAHLRF